MFFIFVWILQLSSAIEIETFGHDIVKHFGYQETDLFMSETDFELSKFVVNLWNENVKVSYFNSQENSTYNSVIVMSKNDDRLKYVQYHYSQTWFMHESNLVYINSWNLRLDSLVFVWQYIGNDAVEIKVITYLLLS